VYPQEGTSGFPLLEYTSLKEPLSGADVTSFACNDMIGRLVWGRKPSENTISELVPCEEIRGTGMRVKG
jgi:hypothetical protein